MRNPRFRYARQQLLEDLLALQNKSSSRMQERRLLDWMYTQLAPLLQEWGYPLPQQLKKGT